MIVEKCRQSWRDRPDERAERLRTSRRGAPVTGERRPVEHAEKEVSGQRTPAEQGDSGQQSDGSSRGARPARTRHAPDC
ncbi:hypothetical protein [Plantactinospora mayteni]|uniref:hypothetical protein n=1 Tax=Plantactinospora mayteni TaxID=566021 RepID=UPI001943A51B|nr:hypothetical protein [Plantactinospora mayteni]